jgi:hypothetical protein
LREFCFQTKMSARQNEIEKHTVTQKTKLHRGVVLTSKQAVEIYLHKILLQGQCRDAGISMRGQSHGVSLLFNISSKTVKDIWLHKTWKHATHHLWDTSVFVNDTSSSNSLIADCDKVPTLKPCNWQLHQPYIHSV